MSKKPPVPGGYERARKPWRRDADGKRSSDPYAPLHAGQGIQLRFPGAPLAADIAALDAWNKAVADWTRDA